MSKEKFESSSVHSGKYIQVKKYNGFYVSDNPGNCKMVTLDSLGQSLRDEPKRTIEAIKIYTNHIDVFSVNLIEYDLIELLSDHFNLVYCNEVPIGYGEGYQFHALFMSHNISNKYKKRILKSKASEQ